MLRWALLSFEHNTCYFFFFWIMWWQTGNNEVKIKIQFHSISFNGMEFLYLDAQ